jgi:pyruvate/2-oxoglutarate dehydrogenase complex dihydrolipoamide acyltransferase (E2) component
MPTRTESAVYFDQNLRVAEAEQLIASIRHEHPQLHVTVFDVVLWALARTFDLHPRLNRFVAGGRVYQREGVWISFTAKTELSDRGTLIEIKRRFDPAQPFLEMVRDLKEATARARSGAQGLADKELAIFLRLPPSLRRGVVRLAAAANAFNLLPRAFVEGDPFFASAFVTNLGSFGLDAAFHHLYEYGTIPLFCALGAIHDEVVAEEGRPTVQRVISVKFSYDERVEDGLYAARALEDFRAMVEHPIDARPRTAEGSERTIELEGHGC